MNNLNSRGKILLRLALEKKNKSFMTYPVGYYENEIYAGKVVSIFSGEETFVCNSETNIDPQIIVLQKIVDLMIFLEKTF